MDTIKANTKAIELVIYTRFLSTYPFSEPNVIMEKVANRIARYPRRAGFVIPHVFIIRIYNP